MVPIVLDILVLGLNASIEFSGRYVILGDPCVGSKRLSSFWTVEAALEAGRTRTLVCS